jgi:hypothetical protein
MLATSGSYSLAGASNSNTQATTATPRTAEMPETVLMPTTHEFSQKFTKLVRTAKFREKKEKE